MKKFNFFIETAIVLLGVSTLVGFNNNYYENENATEKEKVYELMNNSDAVKREFVEKLLKKEYRSEVNYYKLKSDDGSINYTEISGDDLDKEIMIDGQLKENGGFIFISDGDNRYWLNFNKNNYYTDKISDHKIAKITTSNPLTYGEKEVIKVFGDLPRTVERTDGGYKTILSDELNDGYEIYDKNGNFILSYLDNSQGKVTTTWLKSTDDVEGVYNYYLSKISEMTQAKSIEEVK